MPWTEEQRATAQGAYDASRLAVGLAGGALTTLSDAQRARLQLATGAAGQALAARGAAVVSGPVTLPTNQTEATALVRAAWEVREAFADLTPILRANASAEDRAALADAGWRQAAETLDAVDWPAVHALPDVVQFTLIPEPRERRRRGRKGMGLLLGLAALLLLTMKK